MLPIELPEPSADALEVSAELKRVIRAEAYTGLAGRSWVNPGNLRQPVFGTRPESRVASHESGSGDSGPVTRGLRNEETNGD